MISRKQELSMQINQIADGAVLIVCMLVGYLFRRVHIIDIDILPQLPPFEAFLWLILVVAIFGPLLLEIQGFYQYPLEKTIRRSLEQITYAGVWFGLILAVCVVFLRLNIPSRSAMLLFIILAPGALLLRERIFRTIYLHRLRKSGYGESIIIAGSPEKMKALLDSLPITQKLEWNIVAMIDLKQQPVADLVEAMHDYSVGRVLLVVEPHESALLQEAITSCETEGVEAWVSVDFIRPSIARPTFDSLGTTPMLVFRVTPDLSWALLVKNSLDRVAAFFGIIFLSPLYLLLAIGIKLTSPGPIIFRQQRAGRYGTPFTMYKFRSMRTGAEMEREELKAYNQMSGPVFKIDNDPRITRFGSWLRRTSLDELPQLFNVLGGSMSLVGPRPLPIYEVDNFELTAHRRRLSMKPGLTCLWQIGGRNAVRDFDDWVKLDVQYIDNWSLWLDLKILLLTVPVVLLRKGAQ